MRRQRTRYVLSAPILLATPIASPRPKCDVNVVILKQSTTRAWMTGFSFVTASPLVIGAATLFGRHSAGRVQYDSNSDHTSSGTFETSDKYASLRLNRKPRQK